MGVSKATGKAELREKAIQALSLLSEILKGDDIDIEIITQHDPTDITPPGSEWRELIEGNRMVSLTITETKPKEYYTDRWYANKDKRTKEADSRD